MTHQNHALIARLRRLITHEVDVPTYERDLVGKLSDIERWDERDIVFARKDFFRYFGTDSAQYKAYYEAHPEHLAYDTKVGNMPGLGRTGGVDRPMFETQFAAIARIGEEQYVDGEVAEQKTDIPPQRAAEKVKHLARFLGADLAKIGPLHQQWVYTHGGRSGGDRGGYRPWGTPIDLTHHTNAIAMAFQMDYPLARTAPNFPTLLATARGYAMGAWVSVQLAHYIRMLGYSARAHHLNNYQVIAVPVAVDCGLGELSRADYLITREFGLGVRLAIVTTDMPLTHDRPIDLGVQSFCEYCKRCAEECPSRSIPMGDKIAYKGIRKWKLNEETCYRYWHTVGTDCSICMMVCPWTKPQNWFYRMMKIPAAIPGPHQRLIARADRLFQGRYRSGPGPDYIDPYKRFKR